MPVRKLSPELQEKAIKELNEVPKRVEEDIAYIKNWLSQQKYIRARTDDQMILTFLRGAKFSLERTKEKIDMYYTVKTITTELCSNRDPLLPEIQEILSLGVSLPLVKNADPIAPRTVLIRSGLYDPTKISQANIMKTSTMLMEMQMLEDDNFCISGSYILQDMKDITMNHITTASPLLIKKAMYCFQQAYPNRIKGLFFINTSTLFDTMYKLFSQFLTEKLKRRVRLFSSLEELYEVIPKSVLPEEYGGDGGKLDDIRDYWKNKLETNRDWFMEDMKYGTDEKLRPGKPKTTESVFGVEGSFRQLSVD